MNDTKKRRHSLWACVAAWLIFTLGAALLTAVIWELQELNVGIAEILFTLSSPMEGANSGIAAGAFKKCLPWFCGVSALYGWLLYYFRCRNRVHFTLRLQIGKWKRSISSKRIYRCFLALFPIGVWVLACFTIERDLFFTAYLKNRMDKSTIYEDYYVFPSDVEIQAQGKTKNVICLYLESMEITYADTASGGAQEINYMPGLTELAYDNLSFGTVPGQRLGGMDNVHGTGWTSAALMATTSGVPFSFPKADATEVGVSTQFAPGLETLGTVLQQKGYRQEFLCGSSATFGGRRTYFQQHGDYEIYDYNTALQNGDIPQGYNVWWGLEDAKLYEIAKKQLLELSASDAPFNLTLLTVDTHFPDGYLCQLCEKGKYPVPLASIVECADRQAVEFVRWCQEQSFYENTVIVIMGDHPRMDTLLVDGVPMSERKVYTCFLNAQMPQDMPDPSERQYTHMDLFPTILASMGFTIQGDRLGLGTNLFSWEPTLEEQYGRQWLDDQLQKTSLFYEEHFY